jgi:hypothetical protein
VCNDNLPRKSITLLLNLFILFLIIIALYIYMAFSTFSSFSSFPNFNQLAVVLAKPNTFEQLLIDKKPWGYYSAESWTGTTLVEKGGNTARNATTSGVTSGTASGNGANTSIAYLSGTTSSTINWTTGSLPQNLTICSLTRFTNPVNNVRILQGRGTNFVHGHDVNTRGTVFYGSQGLTSNASLGTMTDWLNACGTKNAVAVPNNVLFDGVPSGTASGGSISINSNLTINAGEYSGSNFQFSQLLIFDQVLTATEMVLVSNAFKNYLSTGNLK